ncbi:uncharacterized protein [Coffea arabica]|uniref:Reverse transcriptase domain-containing protein n=1 Tax=Coffea arabica TaxID=13443 RepID=A0ABM4WP42_COFAR
MRAVVWNCRDAGSPLTVFQMEEVVRLHSPEIIFLAETKNKKTVMNKIKRTLKYDSLFVVDPIGDMNDILSSEEKWGGRLRSESSFRVFRNFVNDNQLIDIDFEGIPWTWCNNWDEDGEVKERLDRVLCSWGWRREHGKAKCVHLHNEASDHCMLLLDTEPKYRKWKKRFYFDKNWVQNKEVKGIITTAWGKQQVSWIKKEIAEVNMGQQVDKKGRLSTLKKQLTEAYRKEEAYWGQKARVQWLKEGDRNTRYFHSEVEGRRKKNSISALQRDDGTWCESEEEVEGEINEYFEKLFTSSNPRQFDAILRGIPQVITDQMNSKLTKPVSEMEARKAVFSLHPNKAPGPDAISSFFHSGHLLQAINETIITLIPKVESPISVSQYRPISLCNVMYRIISKILVNRLKSFLHHCISSNQSAFIPDRQIIDNIVVTHESIHCLNHRRTGSNEFMTLKLDMAKTYDRVE